MDRDYGLIMMKTWAIFIPLILTLILVLTPSHGLAASCPPTEPDALGPYYKPEAPERTSVGKGYVLSGVVRSSADCSPVKGAKIEIWMTGPDGNYDDDHRATLHSDREGTYRFESNYPRSYFWRPPHIHMQVTAQGFGKLITQHYPEKGMTSGSFDLVLIPLKK